MLYAEEFTARGEARSGEFRLRRIRGGLKRLSEFFESLRGTDVHFGAVKL
jgi:hypothetical protein